MEIEYKGDRMIKTLIIAILLTTIAQSTEELCKYYTETLIQAIKDTPNDEWVLKRYANRVIEECGKNDERTKLAKELLGTM